MFKSPLGLHICFYVKKNSRFYDHIYGHYKLQFQMI